MASKIDRLYEYLKSLGFANNSELNRISDQKTISVNKEIYYSQTGLKGYLKSIKEYSGILYIDGFSEKKYTEDEVIVLVDIWLSGNDWFYHPQHNIKKTYPIGITLANTPLDLSKSYFEMTVQFHELVVLIESDNGKIIMDGKKYQVADSSLVNQNFEINFLKNK